jgi:hypothetical protein
MLDNLMSVIMIGLTVFALSCFTIVLAAAIYEIFR